MNTRPNGDEERRRTERHPVEDLSGSLLFSHRCRVLDLSERGLAVRTHTPLAPGRAYTLRLERGEGRVDLTGTVAWCRLQGTERDEEGESRPVYRAGLELEEELAEELAGLRELVGSRDVVDVERRITGRIELPPAAAAGEEAAAGSPDLLVRSLSRTGMRFQAPIDPAVGDRLRREMDLEDGPLPLEVEVTEVEEVEDGAGADTRATEVTVGFHAVDDGAVRRLEELIREEREPE